MKKYEIIVLLAVYFFLIEAGFAETERFVESNGILTIEAENYHRQNRMGIFRHWFTLPDVNNLPQPDPDPFHSGASGGKYLEILPDTRVTHDDPLIKGLNFFDTGNNAPRLEYDILINNPGRYYVWVRAYPTGTEDNSIHVGYNNNWPVSGRAIQWCGGKGWYWSSNRRLDTNHCGERNGAYLDLPAGRNTLIFSMREDGFEFDKFILTKDANFTPGSLGPSESSRVNLCNDGKDNNGNGLIDCENPQCQIYNFCRLPLKGRIAISSDGNGDDPDDIAASAAMFAILDARNIKGKLVHKDYGNDLAASNIESIWTEMKKTISEGIDKYSLNPNVFFNAQTQLNSLINNLAKEIDKSSISNPLTILMAGSPEVLYRGLVEANPERRKHVIIISHSWWNDYYGISEAAFNKGRPTKDDIVSLGVQWIQIMDQNEYLNTKRDALPWYFLRDSEDEKNRWVWERLLISRNIKYNKYDISDAGMLYFALTGDEVVTPEKIKTMLESPLKRPSPPSGLSIL